MAFPRWAGLLAASVALVLAANAPLTASAQGGFPPPAPPPYTPAADAKDLKAVLFNWTWHMGMLRGIDEHELIVSLEYQGKGTVQVDGQPCALTKYRASINYQTSGERIQLLPNTVMSTPDLSCSSKRWGRSNIHLGDFG